DTNGGYGTGSPPPGCVFTYQSGTFLGTTCGNGLPQNILQSQKLGVAVASGANLAGHAIPTICGGGLFAFGGPGGNKGGGGVLFELDSTQGFSVNGFVEGQNPTNGAGGGVFSNGKNGANPFLFIPTSEVTGIVAFNGGIGGYVGGEYGIFDFGGGAYVNVTSVSGCH
ncbi:MAG: hypothetical protein WAL82_03510, partial [Candidatus Acidiferrales bacterium]